MFLYTFNVSSTILAHVRRFVCLVCLSITLLLKKKIIRKIYLFKICFRTSGTPKKNLTTDFFFYCPSVRHTFVGWVLKKIEKIDVFKMCFRTSGTPKKNLTSYFFFTPSVCLSTLQCFWHPVNFWHPVANSCDFLKSLGKKKIMAGPKGQP